MHFKRHVPKQVCLARNNVQIIFWFVGDCMSLASPLPGRHGVRRGSFPLHCVIFQVIAVLLPAVGIEPTSRYQRTFLRRKPYTTRLPKYLSNLISISLAEWYKASVVRRFFGTATWVRFPPMVKGLWSPRDRQATRTSSNIEGSSLYLHLLPMSAETGMCSADRRVKPWAASLYIPEDLLHTCWLRHSRLFTFICPCCAHVVTYSHFVYIW